ncbi:Gfo/Idh/MocA family protein [Occultella kanbiaonis]|uniref:Gfo/Idh/MocA family protein n=1 Tax=Occultella kanbiaonis TaxID=2675754 RepID=UPI0013D481B5|nr:Gfo/Idh/MocA family oxidoreductase [Occultella kanbiaonis]
MTTTRPLRVAVAGAGQRATSFFRNVPADLAGRVELAAVAEPEQSRRSSFIRMFGDGGAREFGSSDELLDQGALAALQLDGLVIGTPNDSHFRDICAAARAGLTVMAEKPVVTTVAQCQQLWSATNATPGRVLVGFVLRYVPFYSRIQRIIEGGEIGEVLAIDCQESLSTGLTGVFQKGWRSSLARSGGLIVEKCCHDIDVFNWLVGKPANRVFSMSNRQHFRPRPVEEQLGRFVRSRSTAAYDFGDTSEENVFAPGSVSNPYECDSQIPDRQVVTVEYTGGVLCTLTVLMAQPETNRKIKIFGTNGTIEGDLKEGRLSVVTAEPGRNVWTMREEIMEAPNASDHHGGDAIISEAFWRGVAGEEELSRAGLREGIEAVLVAAAAEESALTGLPVDVATLRRLTFGSSV